MFPLKRSCKQVTALVIAREDQALPLLDKLALRLHMAIGVACPRFERQVLTMRNAKQQWRHFQQPDSVAIAMTPDLNRF